jgi:uncharacterized membrane protein YccC
MSRWPGVYEWLFAVKTFAAAMLAVYIALSIGLDRPYWAMATVYIVSQPLVGSVRSKALYRLLGTLLGATATVVLVPNLVDAPMLLCAAAALWTGLCVYLALLDRTPRSYLFLLAGYTAALIGFPAVETPAAIWDIAVSRVEEIGLGITCATLVAAIVFPRPLAPLLSARILAWVGDVSAWSEDALSEGGRAGAARLRLAVDAVELRMLASNLAYDTSREQAATRWVVALRRRMVLLLPLLSSICDRLAALRAAGGVTPGLEGLLANLRVWMRAGPPPPRREADQLRADIARLEERTDPGAGWNEIMRGGLLARLRELVDVRQDMRDLRLHIEAGGGALAAPLAVSADASDRVHLDHGMALYSGMAAALTILLLCAFWIESGWQAGAAAAEIAAPACSLFAAMDNPTPALKGFLIAALISVVFVGVGLFAILPLAHDFEMLALALALGAFFVPVGLLTAMPRTQQLGSALGFITATLLSLQGAYAADFVSYADGSLATLLGLAATAVMMSIVRSVGAEWSARRLLRAGWRDLAAIPRHRAPEDRVAFAGLLLDRLGLLIPRLAAAGTGGDLAAADALADLRVGVNMLELQGDRDGLPAAARAAVDDALFGAASHFAARAAAGRVLPPSPEVLRDIDRALDAVIALPAGRGREALRRLVGIRLGLFRDAAPYQPPSPPLDEASAPTASERTAA